jgi:hypothetical protein
MVVTHRSGMHDGPTRRPIVHEPGSATGPCSAGSNPGGHGLPIPALKVYATSGPKTTPKRSISPGMLSKSSFSP